MNITSKLAAIATVTLIAASAGKAASTGAASTSSGKVSVIQVMMILDKANTDSASRQILTAYLAGLGEAAGVLINASSTAKCEKSLRLTPKIVREVLRKAVPDKSTWQETAATPFIVNDMIQRAGCKE